MPPVFCINQPKTPVTNEDYELVTSAGISIKRLFIWTRDGPGSSVGIATELRAGRFGIESRWGRDFRSVQTGPVAHPTSCKIGTGYFPWVKCGRGVLLTTHPLIVSRSWKSRAIRLPILWATPDLWRDHCTFYMNKEKYGDIGSEVG